MKKHMKNIAPIAVFILFAPCCYWLGYLVTNEHMLVGNYLMGILLIGLFVVFPGMVASLLVDEENSGKANQLTTDLLKLSNDLSINDKQSGLLLIKAAERIQELEAKDRDRNESIIRAVSSARKSWAKSGTPLPIMEQELSKFETFILVKIGNEPAEYSLKTKARNSDAGYIGLGTLSDILAETIDIKEKE